jgi:hypothetical protein
VFAGNPTVIWVVPVASTAGNVTCSAQMYVLYQQLRYTFAECTDHDLLLLSKLMRLQLHANDRQRNV